MQKYTTQKEINDYINILKTTKETQPILQVWQKSNNGMFPGVTFENTSQWKSEKSHRAHFKTM